jgi:hypothetical protein
MHFRRMTPVLPILLLAATLAGCGLFSNGQNTNVLFAESFDDTAKQMERYSETTGSAGVTTGEFQLQVLEPNYMHWALVNQSFSDTVIEFQARKAAGPDDNLYGAICRYQDDLNFYYLVISSDGYYGIGSVIQGARSLIGSEQMLPSASIQGGTGINHLKLVCEGSTLSLEVNGEVLASVEDTTLADGQVGLLAGAFSNTGVDIRFDNLLVTRPAQ